MKGSKIALLAAMGGIGGCAVIGGIQTRPADGGPFLAGIGIALLVVAALLYSRWRAHP